MYRAFLKYRSIVYKMGLIPTQQVSQQHILELKSIEEVETVDSDSNRHGPLDMITRNAHNYSSNQIQLDFNTTIANTAQQMMSLLSKCNNILMSVRRMLGSNSYNPL